MTEPVSDGSGATTTNQQLQTAPRQSLNDSATQPSLNDSSQGSIDAIHELNLTVQEYLNQASELNDSGTPPSPTPSSSASVVSQISKQSSSRSSSPDISLIRPRPTSSLKSPKKPRQASLKKLHPSSKPTPGIPPTAGHVIATTALFDDDDFTDDKFVRRDLAHNFASATTDGFTRYDNGSTTKDDMTDGTLTGTIHQGTAMDDSPDDSKPAAILAPTTGPHNTPAPHQVPLNNPYRRVVNTSARPPREYVQRYDLRIQLKPSDAANKHCSQWQRKYLKNSRTPTIKLFCMPGAGSPGDGFDIGSSAACRRGSRKASRVLTRAFLGGPLFGEATTEEVLRRFFRPIVGAAWYEPYVGLA